MSPARVKQLLRLGLKTISTEGLQRVRLCLLGSDVPILLDGGILGFSYG